MSAMEGDFDLQEWVQTSDSPLNSDDSYTSTTRGFGDLTIKAGNDNDDNDMAAMEGEEEEDEEVGRGGRRDGRREEEEEAEEANALLGKLAGKFDDLHSTTRNRYRFTLLTELSDGEKTTEPELIRLTDTCVTWPCYVIDDVWFKAKAYFGRKCKLPCCREYAHPHEWARHRRFIISKRYYLGEPGLTSQETDAILRWADLVQSSEWKLGQWNERGALHVKDKKTFHTEVISWSAMEEHLATLAYSKKRPLMLLAARICVEALAKNKGLYTYNQQYWAFARICTDLLKSPYSIIQEGLLLALQLYLRTLKIFHACFTNKCSELASAGLFPVLLDLMQRSEPITQAVIVNILVLMTMHYNYISLVVNMGVLDPLVTLTSTPNDLLRRRVYGCLEVLAKSGQTQSVMVRQGLLPILVRQLTLNNLEITLSCLLTLNSLCHNHRTLVMMLAVDNQLVVKAVMRLLSERDGDMRKISLTPLSNNGAKSLSLTDLHHGESWCTVPRQCLVLATRLCVDRSASRLMVKRGIVGKLRITWLETESMAERSLILETLAVLSRHPRAAEQICQQELLPLFTDALADRNYQEQVLKVTYNLSHRHLLNLIDSGILLEIITAFGDKLLHRKLFPLILSVLAATSNSEKVQALLLTNQAKAYTLLLDIAFNTTDMATLKPCVTTLGHLDASSVPLHVLKPNSLLLVAYVDKLLKAGSDSLVLHGLMQLRDLVQVECLRSVFREHHTHQVVQLLCSAPFKPPVQIMAQAVLELVTDQRARRASSTDSPPRRGSSSGSQGQGQSRRESESHDKVTSAGVRGGDTSKEEGEEEEEEMVDHASSDTDSEAFHGDESKANQDKDGAGMAEGAEGLTPKDANIRVNVIQPTDNESEGDEDDDDVSDANVVNRPNDGNNNENAVDGTAPVDDAVDDNDDFEIISMLDQDETQA